MRRKRQDLIHSMLRDSNPLPIAPANPWALAPDDLRNQVQSTLALLGEADRKIWCQRLLGELTEAGVHVGAALFMLGMAVPRPDELTPSDIGKLLRYIRINSPTAIEALAGPLTELLVVKEEPALATHSSREAA